MAGVQVLLLNDILLSLNSLNRNLLLQTRLIYDGLK